MKAITTTGIALFVTAICSSIAAADDTFGTRDNPLDPNYANLRDVALMFEVLGPSNGAPQYSIKAIESAGLSPFSVQRTLREIETYVRSKSTSLAGVFRRNNGIYVVLGGVPMAIAGYDFDNKSYCFKFPTVRDVVGWPSTDDRGYYIQAWQRGTALLDISTSDYVTKDQRYDGLSSGHRCPDVKRELIPSSFGGANSFGVDRFSASHSVSLAIPMSERDAEELYSASNSYVDGDPLMVWAQITCKAARSWCVIVDFNTEFAVGANTVKISWERFGAFHFEKVLSEGD
jgi:hypothetical protein